MMVKIPPIEDIEEHEPPDPEEPPLQRSPSQTQFSVFPFFEQPVLPEGSPPHTRRVIVSPVFVFVHCVLSALNLIIKIESVLLYPRLKCLVVILIYSRQSNLAPGSLQSIPTFVLQT